MNKRHAPPGAGYIYQKTVGGIWFAGFRRSGRQIIRSTHTKDKAAARRILAQLKMLPWPPQPIRPTHPPRSWESWEQLDSARARAALQALRAAISTHQYALRNCLLCHRPFQPFLRDQLCCTFSCCRRFRRRLDKEATVWRIVSRRRDLLVRLRQTIPAAEPDRKQA
jgi:hypothetical protein